MTGVRCAAVSAELAEPQAGTAAVASAWLCVEQPGPWGADALVDSHLDPAVGAELARRSAGTGVRVVLIRRAGRHADSGAVARRQVFLASAVPGRSWLERGVVSDPKELLDLDFAAVGAGVAPGWGAVDPDPVLLVCTNARRDVCCALWGRPVVAELAGRFPDRVWECTHTGGHRFAPTGVVLPAGYLYGRLDVAFAERVLTEAAAGRVVAERCRGRSSWSRAGQVAELAVRDGLGVVGDVVSVVEGPGGDECVVSHVDGRRWRVRVVERELPPARPTSCGKSPVVPSGLVAESVTAL